MHRPLQRRLAAAFSAALLLGLAACGCSTRHRLHQHCWVLRQCRGVRGGTGCTQGRPVRARRHVQRVLQCRRARWCADQGAGRLQRAARHPDDHVGSEPDRCTSGRHGGHGRGPGFRGHGSSREGRRDPTADGSVRRSLAGRGRQEGRRADQRHRRGVVQRATVGIPTRGFDLRGDGAGSPPKRPA